MKLEKNSKKTSRWQLIKKLFSFVLPYKFKVVIVICALTITASSILILGYGLQNLIDHGLNTQNLGYLETLFFRLVIIIFLLAGASYIRASTLYVLCEKIESDIRKKVYFHVINLSPEFFEINKTSDIVARLTVDTAILNSIIASLLSFVIRNLLMLVGGVVMLFTISLKLTLMVLAIIPVIVIPILFLSKKIRFLSRKAQDQTALIGSHIEESLNGIRTVQSFNAQDYENLTFKKIVEETLNISKARYKLRAILSSMIITLALCSIALVLFIGSNDVINNDLTAGSLSSFIFYAILVATSFAGIGDVLGEIHRAAAATERILELFEVKSVIENNELNNNHSQISNYDINFSKLSFYYPSRPEKIAISDFNLNIKQGEKLAIVGPSGAGKSTIFNLLLRFYNYSSGDIFIGDVNIKTLKLDYLRNLFALVPQEPIIFSKTAFENIKYGSPNASDEEVIAAAKSAEIYDFLNNLPNKLNSFLGEKGVRISVGQKQRIAIARAILKNPKILLLDEATSALDNENERLVQIALDRITKGRTTIMIAHRLSTIAKADRIIVVNDGKIEAIGKYDELIKNCELFKNLARKI